MDNTTIIAILIITTFYFMIANEKKKHTIEQNKKANNNVEQEEQTEQIDASITQEYPYQMKYLLTKTEYCFYCKLKQLCDERNLLICPKVRLEDFVKITTKENFMKYRGYIKSRHIDFLICDSKLHIIMGIELDDDSHNKQSVKKVDNFKDNLFKTINIPLKRIEVTSGDYKQQITEALDN